MKAYFKMFFKKLWKILVRILCIVIPYLPFDNSESVAEKDEAEGADE